MTGVRSEVKTSSKVKMISVNSKYLSLCLVSVAIYLMWMDVGFYLELQNLPVRDANESKVSSSPSSYVYSPFQPITIKQLMLPATVQVIFQVYTLHHCIIFWENLRFWYDWLLFFHKRCLYYLFLYLIPLSIFKNTIIC